MPRKWFLPVVLLGLCCAGLARPAGATVWSVTDNASLNAANSGALAGDVVKVGPGTYTSPIQPAHNGTPGARITYYGSSASPGAAVVNGIVFGTVNDGTNHTMGDYVSVKWVGTSGDVGAPYHLRGGAWYACRGDSLIGCAGNGSLFVLGKEGVFTGLALSGTDNRINMVDDIGTVRPAGNKILNSTFNYTHAAGTDFQFIELYRAQYNQFNGNTFNFTVNATGGYCFPLEMYRSYYNAYENNNWNIVMNSTPAGTKGIWAYRDSSSYNRFVGNHLTTTGSGPISMGLAQSGSFPGSTNHQYFGGNVIKLESPTAGKGAMYWQNGSRSDTLEFNVIAANGGPALYVEPGTGFTGTVVRHNTFYATTATVADFSSGGDNSGSRLSSNIFYSTTSNSGSATVAVSSGMGVDSLGLVFSRGGSAASGLRYAGATGTPGSGGNFGVAGKAAWNTPAFTDSSYATLNTTLRAGSAAQNASFQDGFAGSLGTATADLTPPAQVTDVSAPASTGNSVTLGWTAVGDDGTIGSATAYDVRYSTSPIDDTNWAAATPATGEPSPRVSGSAESFTVTGLAASTTYWFALKVRDDAGNLSPLSNVVSKPTTVLADTTPPAAITDLGSN
jgi:hypothetical protein